MKWEKEEKIIEGLGKLYPDFVTDYYSRVSYEEFLITYTGTAYWVCCLCVDHLNHRIPSLEEYIKNHHDYGWRWYSQYFGIEK